MDRSLIRKILTGGLKTVAAAVPVGGALAQAWDEFESYRLEQRLNELVATIQSLTERFEAALNLNQDYIRRSDEFPALLEIAAERVISEPAASKRHLYALALMKAVAAGPDQPYDDKLSILLTLEVVTESDISILRCFSSGGAVLVDHLVPGSQFAEWSENSRDPRVGPLVLSLSKLAARGILSETSAVNATFDWSGDPQYWANRWRQKSFQLTPFGQTFLDAITE